MSVPSPNRKPRRWLLRIALAVGVVGVVALGLIGWAWWRAQATPEFWEQHREFLAKTPTVDLERLSRSLELDVPRDWTRPVGEGDGVRTVRLPLDQVNAWLAVRLDDYLENQGLSLPEGVGGMMVGVDDGQIVLAAEVSGAAGSRVISVTFAAETDEDGAAQVRLEEIASGTQPLPAWRLIERIAAEDIENDTLREALQTVAAGDPIRPVNLPVDQHREADLLGVEVTPEAVELTVRVRYVEKE